MEEVKPTAELKYDSMLHKYGKLDYIDESTLVSNRFLLEFNYDYDKDTQSKIYTIVENLRERLKNEHKQYFRAYLIDENGDFTGKDTKRVGGMFIPDKLVKEVLLEFIQKGIPVAIGDKTLSWKDLSYYKEYDLTRMIDGVRGPKMTIQHIPNRGGYLDYKIGLESFTKDQFATINKVLYEHLDNTIGEDEILMARREKLNEELSMAASDGISTHCDIEHIPNEEIESLVKKMSESGLCVFKYQENEKDADEIDIENLETKLRNQIHSPKATLKFGKMLENSDIVPDEKKHELYYSFDYQFPEQHKIINDICNEYSSNPQMADNIHPYLIDDNGKATTQDTGIVGYCKIPFKMLDDFTKKLIESGCDVEIGSTKLKDKLPDSDDMFKIVSHFMIDEIKKAKKVGKELDKEIDKQKKPTEREL